MGLSKGGRTTCNVPNEAAHYREHTGDVKARKDKIKSTLLTELRIYSSKYVLLNIVFSVVIRYGIFD